MSINFEQFCANLEIESKDYGTCKLKFFGTQKYLLKRIREGLKKGIRTFVILKGRQFGVSTAILGLDEYWLYTRPGTQMAIVTDNDENREYFRSILRGYRKALPYELKIPYIVSNRIQTIYQNKSRLLYLHAGKKGNLGKAKGISALHATEVSSWNDIEGFLSLRASLSELNPNRLIIYESTAMGHNMFEEIYETAEEALEQEAIFIGWWLKEDLIKMPGDPSFSYWDGSYTSYEIDMIGRVREQYGFDIQIPQIAWYRWKLKEEYLGDTEQMKQNFPFIAQEAFITSGSQFFSNYKLEEAHQQTDLYNFKTYRFGFGFDMQDTIVTECSQATAELTVWDWPSENQRGIYVIGADPAYGYSDLADAFVIQVFRCYRDKFEQVAEYRTTANIDTTRFAWVLVWLAGKYNASLLNSELGGGGGAVLTELTNLKKFGSSASTEYAKVVQKIASNIQMYLYKRADNPRRSHSPWEYTSHQRKIDLLNNFKALFENNMTVIKSKELIKEMKTLTNFSGYIEASGKNKDDRVLAAAFAAIAYKDQLYGQVQNLLYKDKVAEDLKEAPNYMEAMLEKLKKQRKDDFN